MYIERRHNVGKEEAIHKIDSFLDDLMRRQFPGGVTVKEPFKSWSDDAMHFSFKARKGFIGATISGVIRVNDDSVIMDSDLPGLVTAFVFRRHNSERNQQTVGRLISGLSHFETQIIAKIALSSITRHHVVKRPPYSIRTTRATAHF